MDFDHPLFQEVIRLPESITLAKCALTFEEFLVQITQKFGPHVNGGFMDCSKKVRLKHINVSFFFPQSSPALAYFRFQAMDLMDSARLLRFKALKVLHVFNSRWWCSLKVELSWFIQITERFLFQVTNIQWEAHKSLEIAEAAWYNT